RGYGQELVSAFPQTVPGGYPDGDGSGPESLEPLPHRRMAGDLYHRSEWNHTAQGSGQSGLVEPGDAGVSEEYVETVPSSQFTVHNPGSESRFLPDIAKPRLKIPLDRIATVY